MERLIFRIIFLFGVLLSTACAVETTSLQSKDTNDWGLKVVIFDVDQGDAIALLAPNGDVALIDGGRRIEHGKKIAEYLADKQENGIGNITTIKTAVVTHYDSDHITGLPGLIRNGVSITDFIDQGPSSKRKIAGASGRKTAYGKYVSMAGDPDGNGVQDTNESNFSRHKAEVGQIFTLGENDEISIRVISVRGDTVGEDHDLSLNPANAGSHFDENPGSVALLIRYGDFEFYTAGDQTDNDWKSKPAVEEHLVAANAIIGGNDIDVLKVSHHGSDTSTSKSFAESLDPEISIISTKYGRDKLPKRTTLKQLTDVGSTVLITGDGLNADGTYSNSKHSEDDGWTAAGKPIFNDQGNIEILVDNSSKRYLVSGDSFNKSFSSVD